MTEMHPRRELAASEIARNGDAGSATTARTDLAHGPETVQAAPLRGLALPDPPDVDVDGEDLVAERGGRADRFETPPANGEYRGRVEVRQVPQGVAGEDLVASKTAKLTAGCRWIRGLQLVTIVSVTASQVRFREILDGDGNPSSDTRRIHTRKLVAFLRKGRPE